MNDLFIPPPVPFSALPDHIRERWLTLVHQIWEQDEEYNTLKFEDFVTTLQGWIAEGMARLILMRIEGQKDGFLCIEFASGFEGKIN